MSNQHQLRPFKKEGIYYQNYYPEIDKNLTLRSINIEADLDLFHEWHHQPRVAYLWDLNWPKEKLKEYLLKTQDDPHMISMILEFDQEPVGYFEAYWAKEDRIAPYYEVEDYDRGFHFLIGNKCYLGRQNTCAAVRSIMHFIFLDESRTNRIVVEPRSDNQKVLKYAQLVPGWRFIKEFDFPHKRAALLMADRDDFFNGWKR